MMSIEFWGTLLVSTTVYYFAWFMGFRTAKNKCRSEMMNEEQFKKALMYIDGMKERFRKIGVDYHHYESEVVKEAFKVYGRKQQ